MQWIEDETELQRKDHKNDLRPKVSSFSICKVIAEFW